MRAIRVGIVGANPQAGWARGAHMPALAVLPQFELAAVATRNEASAAAAAAAWGARQAFDDPAALAASPDVDLVVVSVRAPRHFDIALAAIEHGKHLLCEWPVGSNLAQTKGIAERAAAAGVRAFAVLQARAAPPAVHARALVAEGYVGRIYSASIHAAFPTWGNPISSAYSADVAAGANVLTIAGGHSLDLATFMVDEHVVDIAGVESHLRREVMAADTGEAVPFTAPDQFACVGALASGAALSAHIVGASLSSRTFQLRIIGDAGELTIEADGMPEIAPLRLLGTRAPAQAPAPIPVPESRYLVPGLEGPALNVAHLYRLVADDLASGSRTAPDLASALKTRALLDAVQHSAAGMGRIVLD
jgi:predicted dehydrogenase